MVQNSLPKEQFFKPSLLYNNKEGFLMINSVGINNKYYNQPPVLQHPVTMRGMTNTLERTPEEDTVVTKPKKKKLSTAAKIGIGLAGVAGGLVGTCVLVSRHQVGKLKKLYNEKLVLSNLPEKLEFQEAKTLEEGIKFAKETLKVPEVDNNFTLEALNFANRGLVDVANANKGKVFIPRKLRFESIEENTVAFVINDIKSPSFGDLCINSKFFDEKFLNNELRGLLFQKDQSCRFEFVNETLKKIPALNKYSAMPDKSLQELIKRFYEKPDLLTLEEKRTLWSSLEKGYDKMSGKTPENIIKEYPLHIISPEYTVYHEMGHLQDMAENLKKLDIMQWEFNPKKIWNESLEKVRTGKEKPNRIAVKEVGNRWNRGDQAEMAKLFKENPKEFKKKYPDLHEFLTNKEIQTTAGEVSSYAQTGIGEFIAECYAEMIAGNKLPDKVMELYKKYNGPKIC